MNRLGRPLLVVVTLLAGCSVSEKSWPRMYITASCHFIDSCQKSSFKSYYDDLADCIDERMDYYDYATESPYDGCTFDKDQAATCLEALRSDTHTCPGSDGLSESSEAKCEAVWDCDGSSGGHDDATTDDVSDSDHGHDSDRDTF